jgi:hypothetical protein
MATRRGPDNTVRFSIQGTLNAVNWANVFWANLTLSGTPSQADLDTWLTAAAAAYKTRWAPNMGSTALYTQAQASLFLPANGLLPSIVAMTGGGTGTPGTGQPQSAAMVISWQTGVYWRGGKPRSYIPCPPEAAISNNKNIQTASLATLATVGNNFRTDINALTSGAITGTQLGFVSFRHGNADRVPPLFFAFTGVKVHPRLGTQRRRLGKWMP